MENKNKNDENNEIKNDSTDPIDTEKEEEKGDVKKGCDNISNLEEEKGQEINSEKNSPNINENNESQPMDIDIENQDNEEQKEVDKLFNDIQNIWQQHGINNLNNFSSSLTQKSKQDKNNKMNINIQEIKKPSNFSFSPNIHDSQAYTPICYYNNRNITYPPLNVTQNNSFSSIRNNQKNTSDSIYNNRGIMYPPQSNNNQNNNNHNNFPQNYNFPQHFGFNQNSNQLTGIPPNNFVGFNQQSNQITRTPTNNFGFNQNSNQLTGIPTNNFGFNQQSNQITRTPTNNFSFNQQSNQITGIPPNNFGFNHHQNNFQNYPPINYNSQNYNTSFENDRKRRKSIRDNLIRSSKRFDKSFNSNLRRNNFRHTYNRNSPVISHSAICDICGMSPIKGDRYKSLVQHDYDLCKNCWMKCKDKSNYQLIKDFKNIDTSVQNGAVVLEINSNGTINPQESKFLESFFDKVLNKNKPDEKKDNETKKNTNEKEENQGSKSEKFKINKEKDIDELDLKVESLDDLIQISELYSKEDFITKNYSINIKGIYDMVPALKELHNLVGLEQVKKKVLDQIIFFSQDLHNEYKFIESEEKEKKSNNTLFQILSLSNKPANTSEEFNKYESCLKNDDNLDMLHTVIEGPPGVGKTIFGKILARIYLSLGITHKDKFKIVRRTDLVGEYLGHTAMKTQKAIDEALGGVLFIDEAYQLGNGSERKIDSYSKECIDTLNQNLSEKKGQFICIIAGYKKELEENFFSVNPGLKRRFSFKYTIDSYTWEELTSILVHKIPKMKWQIEEGTEQKLFKTAFLKEKMDQFPHYGGDIETLLLNVKIEHGKRVFGKRIEHHKKINYEDIENGYKRFLENRKIEKETLPFGMFI